MKITSLLLLAFAAAFSTAHAAEKPTKPDSGLYVRADSGPSFSKDAGTAPIISGGVGYRVNQHVRLDATLGYRGNYEKKVPQSDDGTIIKATETGNTLVGLLNVYGDIATVGSFTPYVGAGIGFANNHARGGHGTISNGVDSLPISSNGANQTNFAWQLSAGTAVALTDQLSLDVGYRFLDLGKFKPGNQITIGSVTYDAERKNASEYAHEMQVGLRYAF